MTPTAEPYDCAALFETVDVSSFCGLQMDVDYLSIPTDLGCIATLLKEDMDGGPKNITISRHDSEGSADDIFDMVASDLNQQVPGSVNNLLIAGHEALSQNQGAYPDLDDTWQRIMVRKGAIITDILFQFSDCFLEEEDLIEFTELLVIEQ